MFLRSPLHVILIPIVILLAAWPVSALGQGGAGAEYSAPEIGRYAIRTGPEDLLQIDVQIWGQVNRPGQYSVPDRTDLIGLMSWAGGPTESAKLRKVLVVRPYAEEDRVREIDIEQYLKSGDQRMIPRLSPGDVVVVPATRSHGLTRWMGVASMAALIANVAVLATRN